ncbi:hypothetical protein Trisim1_002519 [Trichoderma cf. simile WF8]
MGVVLGEEVGYQIGSVSMINKNKQKKTRLAYMTEGVLLRQLSMDRQTLLHHYEARTRRKINISSHDSRRQTKSYFSSKRDSITFVPSPNFITVDKAIAVTPNFTGYKNHKRTIAKISNIFFYDDAGRIRDPA